MSPRSQRAIISLFVMVSSEVTGRPCPWLWLLLRTVADRHGGRDRGLGRRRQGGRRGRWVGRTGSLDERGQVGGADRPRVSSVAADLEDRRALLLRAAIAALDA